MFFALSLLLLLGVSSCPPVLAQLSRHSALSLSHKSSRRVGWYISSLPDDVTGASWHYVLCSLVPLVQVYFAIPSLYL